MTGADIVRSAEGGLVLGHDGAEKLAIAGLLQILRDERPLSRAMCCPRWLSRVKAL
jgi:hypothetical protein